ncbi:MAG: DUF1415 domain-containing protein [Methylomicrobium sp.]
MTNDPIIATRAWLETVVIGLELCPFAAAPFRKNAIRYTLSAETDTAQCLESLVNECRLLDTDAKIDTTLLIYPNAFATFDDYLDFLALAETLLSDQGYEGIYQLASFHPDYCFAGCNHDDPANYTNRSPYPMLHLLREDSIAAVLKRYPDPDNIPQRNIALTRKLGLSKMASLLALSKSRD